jgi:hypothetical protein
MRSRVLFADRIARAHVDSYTADLHIEGRK